MIAPASVPPRGTPPSIAPIAPSRVLIAVAHPRIAAGLEALLDAEHRYEMQRASSGADLEGRAADAVIADAVFIKMNGVPAGIPAIVLLDASVDRASLADRVPLAGAWLTTASTGDELIAALDRILAASTTAATPPALVSLEAAEVKLAAGPETATTERPHGALGPIALLVFGVSCAAVSLVFLWMALRP